MTAERLIRLLQHPEQLDGVPYEELKTLALAYPYSPHLKQLLLLKSKQINHHEYDRNLAAAAALSPDRKKLYKLITPVLVPVAVQVKEEVLELKPIQSIRKELEAMAPVERIQAPVAAVAVPPPAVPEPPQILEKEVFIPTPEVVPVMVDKPKPQPVDFGDWVGQFNLPPVAGIPHRTHANVTPPASIEMPQEDQDENPTPVSTPKNQPVRLAQQLAEKSVSEKEEVRSESLARILILQGYKEKAILMYQRLILDFPEKSAIFAAAIEELKK